MASLTFGGTTVPVAPEGWTRVEEPRAPEVRPNIAGSVVSSITSTQGHVSVWSVNTAMMAATAARSLAGTLSTGVAVTCSGTLLGAGTSCFAHDIEVAYEPGGLHAALTFTLTQV